MLIVIFSSHWHHITVSDKRPCCASKHSGTTSIQFLGSLIVLIQRLQVTVTGTNFIAANIHCRFDLLTVPGTFVSDTRVLCQAPSHWPATVPLELSNNNFDFTSHNVSYLYQGTGVIARGLYRVTLTFLCCV